MEEKTATPIISTLLPFITLILGLFGGYFLTLISDKRKYSNEYKKELRAAYGSWFALQRTAFQQLKSLLDTVVSSVTDLKGLINIQDELKEFQSTLSTLYQTIAEVSLLEKQADRLEKIRSLDYVFDKTYQALLGALEVQKFAIESRKENDEMISSFEKAQNEFGKNNPEEMPNSIETIEKLRKMVIEHRSRQAEALLKVQSSLKEFSESMTEFNDEIKEFFHTLEGKL